MEDWPTDNRVSSWARLLRCGGADELLWRLVEGLWAFPEAADDGFREALHAWAQALCERMMPGAGRLPPRSELEKWQGESEMTTLLEANLESWIAGLITQGRTEGRSEGVAQGRAEERERLRKLAQQLDPKTAAQVSKLLDKGD